MSTFLPGSTTHARSSRVNGTDATSPPEAGAAGRDGRGVFLSTPTEPVSMWIQTRDGGRFDLLEPKKQAINPDTLCVVLARMCRFGGHCREFYSVAQHSLLVESLVLDDKLRLPALLHDAHEAYWGFGDVLRPAKCLNYDVRRFLTEHAKHIDVIVANRFGFSRTLFDHEQIKQADNIALATEARDLMEEPPCPWDALPQPHRDLIEPLGVDEAFRHFSARLHELWKE